MTHIFSFSFPAHIRCTWKCLCVCVCEWAQSSAHESLVLQIFNLQIWWTEWNSGNKCEIGNFKESIHHAWSRWMFLSLDFFPDFLWWPQEKSCMCIWLTRGTKTHLHTCAHKQPQSTYKRTNTFLKKYLVLEYQFHLLNIWI